MQEIVTYLPLFEETDLCLRMAGWQEGIPRQLMEMRGPCASGSHVRGHQGKHRQRCSSPVLCGRSEAAGCGMALRV